jgi:hypothetical protein
MSLIVNIGAGISFDQLVSLWFAGSICTAISVIEFSLATGLLSKSSWRAEFSIPRPGLCP